MPSRTAQRRDIARRAQLAIAETVQTSRYAYLAGIPVALLGLLAYVAVLATAFSRTERALLCGSVLSLVGFTFSAYLTYQEIFMIHAICSWCVSSAVVFSLLAALSATRLLGGLAVVGGLQERQHGAGAPGADW